MFDFLAWLGNNFYEVDDEYHLSGWQLNEIRNHDATGCPGRDFVSGKWGGLVCTRCGK
jgi:hypothetical protein